MHKWLLNLIFKHLPLRTYPVIIFIAAALLLPIIFSCNASIKKTKSATEANSDYAKGELYYHLNVSDSAYLFLKQALHQARLKNDTKSVFEALNLLIDLDLQTGQYDSCKQHIALFEPYLNAAITDSLKAIGQSTIYSSLATIALREGDFARAESFYQRVLENLEKTNYNQRRTAFTYLNIGLIYRNLNKYSQAIEYYIKAAEFADSLQLPSVRYSAFILIGQNYMLMNQYQRALYYYKQAEQLIENPNVAPYRSELYLAYGNLFRLQHRFDSALSYLHRAQNQNYSPDRGEHATILVHFGKTFLDMHQMDSAEFYLQNALDAMHKTGDRVGLYHVISLLSQKRIIEGQPEQSGHYLKWADSLATQTKPPADMLMNHKRRYAEYLQQRGNFKMAAANYQQYLALADSVNNIEAQWHANELDYQYQTAQKERLILSKNIALRNEQLYNTQLEYRWYISFAIFIIALIILIFILFRTQVKRKLERQDLLHEQKKLLTTFQYKTINGQISPHFLFNSLNNIWYIFHKRNEQEAYDYMTSMTQLVRQSLEVSELMVHPLENELKFIGDYLKLEKLRLDNRIEYRIQVDNEVNLQRPVIAMILQQYVENAIKHGLSRREKDGFIHIIIHSQNNGIVIEIIDNGSGIQSANEQKSQGTGRGNKMFADLIKFYNLRNNKQVSVSIDNNTKNNEYPGTIVSIFIPNEFSFQLD